MPDSLWSHSLQHARLPCPSPSPEACSNSCPLSQWCHPTISSSVVLFSSCLQSFPASRSFSMNQVFTSGGQSIGVSTAFLQDWLVWFPCSPRDSQEYSPTPQFKSINSLVLSLLYDPTLTSVHDYWKDTALTRWTFVGKVMSPLFNMQSSFVIGFLPRSKSLLILWL